MIATRFAPSPTGLLHLGHALSALLGWRLARAAGGRFVLRIEDIDPTRCRPAFEAAILEDLAWLGIDWDGPVLRQSERLPLYAEALERLRALGVVYPCFCSRADIAAAGGAPQGPEGPLYPGTCRGWGAEAIAARAGTPAWRIDVAKAAALAGPLVWEDATAGVMAAQPERLGDIVLARRDIGAAYNLAVVVDDAAQGITDVVRGVDLFEATHVQRLLQALLGLPVPRYHHHALVTGPDGKRLAKRDGGSTIAAARAAGEDPKALGERLLARWGGGAA
jgi:glutamyl-Q tRNA(Asp) synthetase